MSLEDQRSCKCHTMKDGTIIYCDMHEAGPLLLEALKDLTAYVNNRYGNHGPLSMWGKVHNSIDKAEGRK